MTTSIFSRQRILSVCLIWLATLAPVSAAWADSVRTPTEVWKGGVTSINKTSVGFAPACDSTRMMVINDWESVKFDSSCENSMSLKEAGVGGAGDMERPELLSGTDENAIGGTGSNEPADPKEKHQQRQDCSFVVSRYRGKAITAHDVTLSEDRSKLHLTPTKGEKQAFRREEIRLIRLDC